jgi:methyl-accepting chemotaxis protein
MASPVEPSGGIGRTTTFVLILVSLLCISLIGGAGYIKFQIDRTAYNLATISAELSPVDALDFEGQKKNDQKIVDASRKRQIVQRTLDDWSLALTLTAWVGLILAAGLIISIYLIVQRRNSPALRALGQSISNLAKGDMQTPIWGVERHDCIGELARAVDLARYHFSQLPDMSILSDQGPVRIKFEGGAKTLFEAMVQQLTTQASRVGDEAQNLSKSASSQHRILSEMPMRINAMLDRLQKFDETNTNAMQNAFTHVTTASEKFEKLIPFMQTRAQNMAEVTQVAGTQIASTLKGLIEAEQGLRLTASHSTKAVQELSESSKDLSEKIFAALNLVRVSGKMLSETTESSQSSLKNLIDNLTQGESKLESLVDRVGQRLEATAKAEESVASFAERTESSCAKMDQIIQSMGEHHAKFGEQIDAASNHLNEVATGFDSARQSMSDVLERVKANSDLLGSVLNELKTGNEQVLGKLNRTSETGYEVVQHLSECSQKLMTDLQEQLETQAKAAQLQIAAMAKQGEEVAAQTSNANETLLRSIGTMDEAEEKLRSVQDRFADMMKELGGALEKQVSSSFGRTEEFSRQNLEKLSSLTGSVDQALQRLSVLGQLTGTLGTVAGQLGQLIPTIAGSAAPLAPQATDVSSIADKVADELSGHIGDLLAKLKAPSIDIEALDTSALSEKLFAEFEEKWKASVNQIDSVRDDLAELLERQKDHLEMRLVVLDKQIKGLTGHQTDSNQIALLQEIIDALAVMNTHLAQPIAMASLDTTSAAETPN